MAVAAQLLIAFAALAASVEAGQTAGLDADVGAARGTPGTAWAATFDAITDLGGVWTIVALVAVAAVSARALTSLFKAVFARERPTLPDAVGAESSFAFPSGHASAATAFYGALALLVLRSGLPRRVRIAAAFALGLLIAAIAFSRVYLGVHYASDVLAGVLLGAASLAAASEVRRLIARRHARA